MRPRQQCFVRTPQVILMCGRGWEPLACADQWGDFHGDEWLNYLVVGIVACVGHNVVSMVISLNPSRVVIMTSNLRFSSPQPGLL